MEDQLDRIEIILFPNPTSNKIYLQSSQDYDSEVILAIYDVSGRQILTKTIEGLIAFNQVEIDVSHFKEGIYILKLFNDNLLWIEPVVKQ